MKENFEEKPNKAIVAGQVCEGLKFSHEIEGEKFFEFKVKTLRLSGFADEIPVTTSERILLKDKIVEGNYVKVLGQYRSFNRVVDNKKHLILTLFAKDISQLFEPQNLNDVKLCGYICRPPVFRTTPFEREICDVHLAVNRQNFNRSDYIPLILWGRNARFVKDMEVGSKIGVSGRIQSREYQKQTENGVEKHTAYEVSCQTVTLLEKQQKFEEKEVANK